MFLFHTWELLGREHIVLAEDQSRGIPLGVPGGNGGVANRLDTGPADAGHGVKPVFFLLCGL